MADDADLDIWQDVSWADDGLSVVTYSQSGDEPPVTEDESYWTWSELAEQFPSVYVLEQTPDGDPTHLLPSAVFTDFDVMDQFVSEEHDSEAGWRWTEHELDEYASMVGDDPSGEGESPDAAGCESAE